MELSAAYSEKKPEVCSVKKSAACSEALPVSETARKALSPLSLKSQKACVKPKLKSLKKKSKILK